MTTTTLAQVTRAIQILAIGIILQHGIGTVYGKVTVSNGVTGISTQLKALVKNTAGRHRDLEDYRRYRSQHRPPITEEIYSFISRGGDGHHNDETFVTDSILISALNRTTAVEAAEAAEGTAALSSEQVPTSITPFQQQCDERSMYIKEMLQRRYLHVQSGKRMRDITMWMKQADNQNSTGSIISIHGIQPHQLQSTTKVETRPEISTESVPTTNNHTATLYVPPVVSGNDKIMLKYRNKRDPFPTDRRNLNFEDPLALTEQQQHRQEQHTPVGCFIDATGEMSLDVQPPTTFQLGVRMGQLFINFAPIWSTMGIAMVSSTFRQQYWYKWITRSIGRSGAAWIKWGQWSATRNDMFPDALCDQLSALHASAPEHEWSYSALIMEQSLGLGTGTLHCVFDDIDTQPIASGSIAQVHRAILCGQPVALKIRHPNVRQLMELDFRLMTIAATIMDKIPALSWLHIRESIAQFSYTIAAQAHLQVEARHLELLNYNFRTWSRVSFPKPIFASSSVIIETFEPGKITTDIIDQYNDLAVNININHYSNSKVDPCTDSGVTVIEAPTEMVNTTVDDCGVSELLSGYDLMPVKLAKFLVSTGVSMYLKMLLVDNLVRYFVRKFFHGIWTALNPN
jgi:ABC1 atypical kinase-like domain